MGMGIIHAQSYKQGERNMPLRIKKGGRALSMALALWLGCTMGHAASTDRTGPLVSQLPSNANCQTNKLACNRLALDDENTTASIDEARREIRIANTTDYTEETVVADVLLHATARVSAAPQPYLIHLVISKKGTQWKHRLSTYSVMRKSGQEPFDFERWTVYAGEDKKPLLSPGLVNKALGPRSLKTRAKDFFVQAVDLRQPSQPMPAVELSLGVGPLSFRMTRAHYAPPPSVREGRAENLLDALSQEDWFFDFQTLSSLVPLSLIRHDLFLFGLDRHPMLQDAMKAGFRGDERLKVGIKDGHGFVQLDERVEPYDQAAQTALVFLRDTYLGMLLNAQAAALTSPAKKN
jgi:hypothetical protein